jgi:hypothetical protein
MGQSEGILSILDDFSHMSLLEWPEKATQGFCFYAFI